MVVIIDQLEVTQRITPENRQTILNIIAGNKTVAEAINDFYKTFGKNPTHEFVDAFNHELADSNLMERSHCN